MSLTWVDVTIAAASAAAGGFMGAFGFWLISKLETWFRQPLVRIEFGTDYPFRSRATFQDGTTGDFIRVRVLNKGRSIAKNCSCYVRRVLLSQTGQEIRLPSEELMLTSWVPREAAVRFRDIPAGIEFLADIAHAWKDQHGYFAMPVFDAQNSNVKAFREHTGDFEMEVVVIGANFYPVSRLVKFRFDGGSPNLVPIL